MFAAGIKYDSQTIIYKLILQQFSLRVSLCTGLDSGHFLSVHLHEQLHD